MFRTCFTAAFAMILAAGFASAAAPAAKKPAAGNGAGLEAMFKKLDTNSDGQLSLTEFDKLGQNAKQGKGKGAAQGKNSKATDHSKLFNHLDTNKDGHLSLDEFKKMGAAGAKAKKAN